MDDSQMTTPRPELQAVIDAALQLTSDEQVQVLNVLTERYFEAMQVKLSEELDQLLVELELTDLSFEQIH